MRACGSVFASWLRSGDVVLLSGPLGAGKTTFMQGVGAGLGIEDPVVSPTFTIAREMDGRFADGSAAHLVHVDAYRIGGVERGDAAGSALMDELESLGLDEELESPSEGTVVLMEWGEQMAGLLSPDRMDVSIDRSATGSDELTADGVRTVRFMPSSATWAQRMDGLLAAFRQAHFPLRVLSGQQPEGTDNE
ncbi:MAG: tRNA (adenosine(37)-N6)-threonylcarbamoyltransferase complex ATPase subunit type 1 TsaE [Aeriscardovia sp.]|nr:tRNA (adenosine(37)-N6)-threonylcarbamoyltransferase complex ATPase subunit type 1 TsaE [Aeriscardovia sp.]